MPSFSGTSILGGQVVAPNSVITAADFDIVFPQMQAISYARVGYGYVFARQNAIPNYNWLLWRGVIAAPGTYTVFPSNFGFSNFQYRLYIDWNIPNLQYIVTI